MFSMLETMLLRSGSLPFSLRIPHRPWSPIIDYLTYLRDNSLLDVRRLVLFDGPWTIFSALIEGHTPLPTLTSLILMDPPAEWAMTIVKLPGDISGDSLSNIQALELPFIRISPRCPPWTAVSHLTCSFDVDSYITRLFQVFPNVRQLQVNNVQLASRFPPVSLPSSLRVIVLRSAVGSEINLLCTLKHWAILPIPRLIVLKAYTLQGILPLFLAMHAHPISIRLNSADGEIEFCAPPDSTTCAFTWSVTPSWARRQSFLSGLEARSCDRLLSILVALEQLGQLFAERLQFSWIERLEFRFDGTQESPRLQANEDFVIRVPRLQHVGFSMAGNAEAIHARMDETQSVLVLLRGSFRSLIVYDGDLLEFVTLSAPAACAKKLDFASFAFFAKEYRISAMG